MALYLDFLHFGHVDLASDRAGNGWAAPLIRSMTRAQPNG